MSDMFNPQAPVGMPQMLMQPDVQTGLLSLQRNRAIANAIMQQAMTPIDPLRSSGRYIVPVSPFEGISKILLGGIAGKMEGDLDQKQADLNNLQAQALRGMFGSTQTAPMSAGQAAGATDGAFVNPAQSLPGAPAPDPSSPSVQLTPGPMSMSNNPNADFARYMMDPATYTKTLMENNALTNDQKNAAAAAGGNPAGMQHIMLAQAIKNADVEHKSGNFYSNSLTGYSGYSPHVPENSQPTSINPQTGRIGGVAPIPGAIGMEGANAAAKAAGEGSQLPVTAVDPATGMPIFMSRTQAAHGGGGGAPSLPAGATDYATKLATEHADLQRTASTVPTLNNALDNILALTKTMKFGPGVATAEKWKAYAGVIPGINPNQSGAANVAEFKKYVSNLSQQAGYGTDAQMQNVLNGLPKDDIPNEAIQKLVPFLKAQNEAIMTRANAAQSYLSAHGNNPTSLGDFNAAWRSAADPQIFQLHQMAPEEQQAYVQHLSPSAAASLAAKRTKLKMLMGQ